MDSTRQNKISRLIQKELSEILLRLQKETRGVMVSVSAVRVSPDLGIAKAYLSVFPSEKGNEVVEHLKIQIIAQNGNKTVEEFLKLRNQILAMISFAIKDNVNVVSQYLQNNDSCVGS